MPRRKRKEIEAGVQLAEHRSIRAIARPAVEASSQVFTAIKTIHSSQRLASFLASGLVRTYDLFNHQFTCVVTSDQETCSGRGHFQAHTNCRPSEI